LDDVSQQVNTNARREKRISYSNSHLIHKHIGNITIRVYKARTKGSETSSTPGGLLVGKTKIIFNLPTARRHSEL